MPWWTWLAVAVVVVAGIVAAAFAVVLGLRLLRALKAARSTLLLAVERLATEAEALAGRAERTAGRTAEVEAALERVRRSSERVAVLRWALGDSIETVTRLRRAMPRK